MGRVFNASFFDDEPSKSAFLDWLSENALQPTGVYHACLAPAAAADELPTAETLLFGAGKRVLADTRFGASRRAAPLPRTQCRRLRSRCR